MPTFVESCYCRGAAPKGVANRKRISRPEIMGTLLRDRLVPRLIIAPQGSGKSHVAFEYASMMFAFRDVLWLKCDSPCFIRDLDAHCLFDDIYKSNPNVALVVFEDVPELDFERSQYFEELVNLLLSRQCEVLITCIPSVSDFSRALKGCMAINSDAMLLSDEELSIERIKNGLTDDISNVIQAEKMACIAWGEKGHEILLSGAKREAIPREIKLAMFCMFVTIEGSIANIETLLGKVKAQEAFEYIGRFYPYFGIDIEKGTYRLCEFLIKDIANCFCKKLDEVATAAVDKDTLTESISYILMKDDRAQRACEFLGSYVSKKECSDWLLRNGWKIIGASDPLSFVALHDFVKKSTTGFTDSLNTMRACALILLKDEPGAKRLASQISHSKAATAEEKLYAAVLLIALGNHRISKDALSSILNGAQCVHDLHNKSLRSFSNEFDTIAFTKALMCVNDDPHIAGMDKSKYYLDDLVKSDSQDLCIGQRRGLLAAITWHLKSCIFIKLHNSADMAQSESLVKLEDATSQRRIVKKVTSSLNEDYLNQGVVSDWMLAFLINEVSRTAHEDGYSKDPFLISAVQVLLIAMDENLVSRSVARDETLIQNLIFNSRVLDAQCEEYKKAAQFESPQKLSFVLKSSPRSSGLSTRLLADQKPHATVPELYIGLFGGIDVRIGDETIDPRKFSRRKCKDLLAILAINKGKELSRINICQQLWPKAVSNSCDNNFYGVWGLLKKALSFDGWCPYLIRSQDGCMLDPRFVRTDVEEFDELCRSLMFGEDYGMTWEQIFWRIEERFVSEILPTERRNEYINTFRFKCRSKLTDALLAASVRLGHQGEATGALWLAREAKSIDRSREDAYIALMEAQIASEQRGKALETFFECKKFLSDELGLDPSMRLIQLYRSIIETIEPLA